MAAAALVLPAVPIVPPTYHRIITPTLRIPTDPLLPVPVGLLACQRDPLLRELTTTVVSCNAHQVQATPANNRKKRNVTTVDNEEPLFEVVLHDTVVFPEGGGQPSDIGVLRTVNGECYDVVEAKRRGGHAIHFVRAKKGHVAGLDVGAHVVVALGEAGHKKRLDHMCMHTSQHLLSALLETRLALPTLSWALTAYPAPAYVELPRALTQEEIISIQEEANALAFEGRSVHVEVEELDRARETGAVKLENGRTVGKALPDDYTGGVKRTIVIDGIDRNLCCGTHLPSLHNLQLFLLPQTEILSRASVSSARLFFLCGPRLIAHLASTQSLLTTTSLVLSCGLPLVPERVTQVVDERRRADKRAEELEAELAMAIAKELFAELSSTANEVGPLRKHYHRADDPSRALGFLQAVSTSFAALLPASPPPFVIIISSSPASQSSTSTSTVLITSSDELLIKAVGDGLKTRLGVKGGGKGVRWSGKWVGVWKDAREGVVVQEVLESVGKI